MHRDAAPFEFCDGELKVEFENVWESLLANGYCEDELSIREAHRLFNIQHADVGCSAKIGPDT
jgi:hypothetical protein